MANQSRKKRKQKAKQQLPTKQSSAKAPNIKSKRFRQWLLGTVLGLIVLSIIANHISAVIPNPFSYFYRLVNPANADKKASIWHIASVKSELKREVSIATWRHSASSWAGDSIHPGEIRQFSETGPICLSIQGDFILQLGERQRLTHTYKGDECYELETKTFDHQPTDEEIKQAPINKITPIAGGPYPKEIDFVDGTKISFDVFGPTGIKLKALYPQIIEGQAIYPFQIKKEGQ